MDLDKLVAELTRERDRLGRAIEALMESVSGKKLGRPKGSGTKKRRRGLTAEGRRRLSIAMKKRWAERKKMGTL